MSLLCVDCDSVDEPHDQNPEQRTQLDDVPEEFVEAWALAEA